LPQADEAGMPTLLTGGELPPLREIERRYVRLVLERFDGNKKRAADCLDIGRRTLYRYLEEL
jgi:DNA-binding NtrC family response regulator